MVEIIPIQCWCFHTHETLYEHKQLRSGTETAGYCKEWAGISILVEMSGKTEASGVCGNNYYITSDAVIF